MLKAHQLLDNNDGTSLLLPGDFGQVDGDLRRRNTNTDTVEDAASDEHSIPIAGNLYGRPYEPPDAGLLVSQFQYDNLFPAQVS